MGDVCLIAESMEENGWCPGGQMPGSVIAWDLVRVVNLARWSYLCGYLNEDEMWQVMQLAADTVRLAPVSSPSLCPFPREYLCQTLEKSLYICASNL